MSKVAGAEPAGGAGGGVVWSWVSGYCAGVITGFAAALLLCWPWLE